MLLSREERMNMRNTKAFRASNKPWNDLHLNRTANIGAVMFLIKESKAISFNEWEEFYFKSGAERIQLLRGWVDRESFRRINHDYGRTADDLLKIAKEFADNINVPIETAYNYVYIRVIDETWLGYSRELTAISEIKNLCQQYSNITISDVDSYKDADFAVDFEIRKDNLLRLGIQLKSTKYKNSDLIAVDEIKEINAKKNKHYFNKYGAEVMYLYFNNGHIVNLYELKNFLDTL